MSNHITIVRGIFCSFLLISYLKAMEFDELFGGKQEVESNTKLLSYDDFSPHSAQSPIEPLSSDWLMNTYFVPSPGETEVPSLTIHDSVVSQDKGPKKIFSEVSKRPLDNLYGEKQSKKPLTDYEAFFRQGSLINFKVAANSTITHFPKYNKAFLMEKLSRDGLLTNASSWLDTEIDKEISNSAAMCSDDNAIAYYDNFKARILNMFFQENEKRLSPIYSSLEQHYKNIINFRAHESSYNDIHKTKAILPYLCHLLIYYRSQIDFTDEGICNLTGILKNAFFPSQFIRLLELKHRCQITYHCLECTQLNKSIIAFANQLFYCHLKSIDASWHCQSIVRLQAALLWNECSFWILNNLNRQDRVLPYYMLLAGVLKFSYLLNGCPEILDDNNALEKMRKEYALDLCKKCVAAYNQELLKKTGLSKDVVKLPKTLSDSQKSTFTSAINSEPCLSDDFLRKTKTAGLGHLLEHYLLKLTQSEIAFKKTQEVIADDELRLILYNLNFVQTFADYLHSLNINNSSFNSFSTWYSNRKLQLEVDTSFEDLMAFVDSTVQFEKIMIFFVKHFLEKEPTQKSMINFLDLYIKLRRYVERFEERSKLKTDEEIKKDYNKLDVINFIMRFRNILIGRNNDEGPATKIIRDLTIYALGKLEALTCLKIFPATYLYFYDELLFRLEIIDGLLVSDSKYGAEYFNEKFIDTWMENIMPRLKQFMQLDTTLNT